MASAEPSGNPGVVGLAGFGIDDPAASVSQRGLVGVGPDRLNGIRVRWLGAIDRRIPGIQSRQQFRLQCLCFLWGLLDRPGRHLPAQPPQRVPFQHDGPGLVPESPGRFILLSCGSPPCGFTPPWPLPLPCCSSDFILLDIAHFGYPEMTRWAGYELMLCAALGPLHDGPCHLCSGFRSQCSAGRTPVDQIRIQHHLATGCLLQTTNADGIACCRWPRGVLPPHGRSLPIGARF